jgi:hypothetical protein
MNFRTEAPYVITTLGGRIKSYHWCEKSAIKAAKEEGSRVVCGRHRGVWSAILTYIKGVRQ